ncbi:DUF6773 family protein [Oceanirhabdus sp. W0125-5]|uniref:DUF6773 family protein n=1 Tax=Oceanirhabdus sp. W0125-5 TaxID=2999116 RepID=UPI0022F309AF|nr:DUF6773 family protein [Oceanirhabdus sp. W0125-5]WBW97282.1 hypothetical protein OW730_00060 [Oceanirhabdus sp. W0125-5]
MKLFKKRNQIVDERIENAENKIYKEVYYIIVAIAFVSMVIKHFLYGTEGILTTEFWIIVLPAIYCQIRKVSIGIYYDSIEMHNRSSKVSWENKNIIIGVIFGLIISGFFGIRSAILFGGETKKIFYFLVVFVAAFMIYVPFFVLVTVISNSISKKLSKKVNSKDEA